MGGLSSVISALVPITCVIALGIAFVPLARRVSFGWQARQASIRGLRLGLAILIVTALASGALLSLFQPHYSTSGWLIGLVAGVSAAMLISSTRAHDTDGTVSSTRHGRPLLLVVVALLVSWGVLAVVRHELQAIEAFGTRNEEGQMLFLTSTGSSTVSMVTAVDFVVAAVLLAVMAIVTTIAIAHSAGTWRRHRGYLFYLVVLAGATTAVVIGTLAQDGREAALAVQRVGSTAITGTGQRLFPGLGSHAQNLEALAQLLIFGGIALLLAVVIGWSRGRDGRLVASAEDERGDAGSGQWTTVAVSRR